MERAILHFSGGKDSTAMLYWLRDLVDQFDVMTCDTGLILQEVRDHIQRCCADVGAKLIVIHPPEPILEYHKRVGLPSDVVPVETTYEAQELMHIPVKQKLQSYLTCCYNMIMKPLDDATRDLGYNVVLRGSKKADARVGVEDGFVSNGVLYLSPIWDWSHKDVLTFLSENRITLPPHYRDFADSLDCAICTGHLRHCGVERIRYIRRHQQSIWPELLDRLTRVQSVLSDQHRGTVRIIKAGLKDGGIC